MTKDKFLRLPKGTYIQLRYKGVSSDILNCIELYSIFQIISDEKDAFSTSQRTVKLVKGEYGPWWATDPEAMNVNGFSLYAERWIDSFEVVEYPVKEVIDLGRLAYIECLLKITSK